MQDVRAGFVEITRHSLAMVGLVLLALALTFASRPQLQTSASEWLLGWLSSRQDDVQALALDELQPEQARVTRWLSRKYRIAPQPLSTLVAEAWQVGQIGQVPPTLILAVMAIESRFNPYAQSPVGAQGLMQVLTRVHTDKYEDFGGKQAALDPVANLRVGVQVLQDCIRNAGSTEGGLRCYVGAVNSDASGYIAKVKAEQERLRSVAQGLRQPASTTARTPAADSRRELEAEAGSSEPGKPKSS